MTIGYIGVPKKLLPQLQLIDLNQFQNTDEPCEDEYGGLFSDTGICFGDKEEEPKAMAMD